MPRLSQLMIRAALLWLATGYTLGGTMLFNKGVGWWLWPWSLRSSHVHVLLGGWLLQMAFGVAYWILPRHDAAGDRGKAWPVWVGFGALNLGVACAALRDPLITTIPAGLGSVLFVIAGCLYVIAITFFFSNAWPRVLSFRLLPRPEREQP